METRGALADSVLGPLPSGLVTFVFTDIEGSTKLLKRLPESAAEVFDRHNAIIRAAIGRHGGHEVNTEGDSFFVAFDDADQALATCAAAQASLTAEPWPEGGDVRVRMGVHSGVAAPKNDNYLALAVHQAARVSSTAHGGQIIISNETLEATQKPLPGTAVALGQFRVRDFDEPEVLYRLDPTGVPVTDRQIRALPAGRHNLVKPPTSFVGRTDDVQRIASKIAPGHILNLVGPGGIGKSRLAIEVGLSVASDWADGVWLIELADLADSSLVPAAIADALGLSPSGGSDTWPEVLAWARNKQSLLVVDNLETHLEVCSQLLSELLREPGIAVLATSREPVQVAGETVYRLDPLDLPEPGNAIAVVRSSPSVQLFVDRARARQPDFELDEAMAGDVALLCKRLDGLPLAIEIAAARVSVLQVSEILDGLGNRFGLLRSSDRNLPERQRTMDKLLSWSHDLLSPAEQIAFRRLAVFGGTFSVDAAVATLADAALEADDVPELVWALVDKSLLVADLAENGTRYRLLETVGDFADRLLVKSGEGAATARRSAEALLERIGPWLMADRRWIGEVDVELANIRSLIERLSIEGDQISQELAQGLFCSLARYHDVVQSFGVGIDELVGVADRLQAPTPTRVVMLTSLADLRLRQADTTNAQAMLDAAAALATEVGAPTWNDAAVDRTRGEVLLRLGAHDAAIAVARDALGRNLSQLGQARIWNLDGIARYLSGDLSGAFAAFERELDLYEQLGVDANMASAHGNLAEVAMHLHEVGVAAKHQQACIELALIIGQPVMLAYSSLIAARMAADQKQWSLALTLQSSAERHLGEAGHTLYDDDQTALDRLRADALVHIGDEAVATSERSGGLLKAIDAAALATEVFTTVGTTN